MGAPGMSAIVFDGGEGTGSGQAARPPPSTSVQEQLLAYRRQQAQRAGQAAAQRAGQATKPVKRERSPPPIVQVQPYLSEDERLDRVHGEIVKRRRESEERQREIERRQRESERRQRESEIQARPAASLDKACACRSAHCRGLCLAADPTLQGGVSDSEETAFHG